MMKNVSDVLFEYKRELQATAERAELGGSESNLLRNLNKVVERNRNMVYLLIGMLIISFILAIVFIWFWRDSPTVLAGVFTATGITVPWVITTLTGLWKDISKAETLHVLIAHLDDPETTKKIVNGLSSNIYGKANEI
jgi:hypothetical protein